MSDPATSPDKSPSAPLAATVRPSLWSGLRAAFTSWWGPGPGGRPRESSDELAEDRTDLAATRTLMAADRTLMAWVRTSLSLSSFGFTIYKVLQGIAEAGLHMPHRDTPLVVGLFLTGLGSLAIVMGTVEYTQALRDLRRYLPVNLARPVLVLAMLMGLVGLFLFFSIVTKLL